MTTQILIEFDPKDASPLDVINTLKEVMQKHFEEKNVKEFAVSLIHVNESDIIDFVEILEIQPPPKEETTPQEAEKK